MQCGKHVNVMTLPTVMVWTVNALIQFMLLQTPNFIPAPSDIRQSAIYDKISQTEEAMRLVVKRSGVTRRSAAIVLYITLRPRRNEQHFADDIFKRIFFNENV